jgi:hypothetical protein
MDKDRRFVVHDVISDYEHLVSVSSGDDDERHIIVYRRGHEPEEALELIVDKVAPPFTHLSHTTLARLTNS